MRFKRHIGIDYSGAQFPTTRLRGLQIYEAQADGEAKRIKPHNVAANVRNWTRYELAGELRKTLEGTGPVVIGIDHGFSFPLAYMELHQIETWDGFLDDFVQHWPTDCSNKSVDRLICGNHRWGERDWLRLCEKWTSSAKSVFEFKGPGVAHSTHAGLPWLRRLRRCVSRCRVHFWPFDGFEVPENTSVVAEVYPSLFRRRYEKPAADEHAREAWSNEHERDAWSVAKWLREMDGRRRLDQYFTLEELLECEKRMALLEGWILGVR